MNTATIKVQHVFPPKEGKQYGAIKGANNESWPVKAERIREFEPGNSYELAYTESNNGWRNIIGVKKIVVEAPAKAPVQGNFTQVDMRPQQNGQAHLHAGKDEQIFTMGGLFRDIEANRVGSSEDELVERTVLWRNVWRRAFSDAAV